MQKKSKQPVQHFYQKKAFLWPVGIFLAVILFLLIWFRVSPWPGSMIIRWVFENDSAKVLKALEKHTPASPVASVLDQQYQPGDKDAVADVYFPESTTDKQRLPVVIWTHGGAWLSGSKSNAAPYFKLLAAEGFTVIAPNYSLAPDSQYPKPLHQLNDLYAYVHANAERFHADVDKIVLAGDSAGSQLSSQMAAMVTNSSYADEVGVTPTLKPSQLRGVVLNCGIYMMEGLTHPDPLLPRIVGWGDDVSVWAYSGTKDFSDPVIKQMSAYYQVTNKFPATYITGGNADPLTDAQSKPFADKLKSLGVNVTTLFYSADHQPKLPHEYQFNLDNLDGMDAFHEIVAFIKNNTK